MALSEEEKEDLEFQSNDSLAAKTEKLSVVKYNVDEQEIKFRRGEKLIEQEKAEIGNVRVNVYRYYLSNVGYNMLLGIFGIQVATQCFDIASNAWLGQWSEDDTIVVDNVVNTGKRDMYLGVYGAIGLAQGRKLMQQNNLTIYGSVLF